MRPGVMVSGVSTERPDDVAQTDLWLPRAASALGERPEAVS